MMIYSWQSQHKISWEYILCQDVDVLRNLPAIVSSLFIVIN